MKYSTFIGAITGAMLMAPAAMAQNVEQECKTDLRTVDHYSVSVCVPQGNNYLRGGSYGG